MEGMQTHPTSRGVTLVELLIGLVIFAGVSALGMMTFQSFRGKQQLAASIHAVEYAIQRAQGEAIRQGVWTCVKFPKVGDTSQRIRVFMDKIEEHQHSAQPWPCGKYPDGPEWVRDVGTRGTWRGNVTLAVCSSLPEFETSDGTKHRWFWFDPTGKPNWCVAGICRPFDVQLVFSTPKLPSGSRSREIEVTSAGLIRIVKPGEKGFLSSIWAKFAEESGGCE
jgi:prepilin-type N-terminal cleavage/methylation domain-containing protein